MIFNSLTFVVFFALVLALHTRRFFVDHEEDQPAGRELPLLRGVEPAVRHPAVGLDGGRLVGRAVDGHARSAQRDAQGVDADLASS